MSFCAQATSSTVAAKFILIPPRESLTTLTPELRVMSRSLCDNGSVSSSAGCELQSRTRARSYKAADVSTAVSWLSCSKNTRGGRNKTEVAPATILENSRRFINAPSMKQRGHPFFRFCSDCKPQVRRAVLPWHPGQAVANARRNVSPEEAGYRVLMQWRFSVLIRRTDNLRIAHHPLAIK